MFAWFRNVKYITLLCIQSPELCVLQNRNFSNETLGRCYKFSPSLQTIALSSPLPCLCMVSVPGLNDPLFSHFHCIPWCFFLARSLLCHLRPDGPPDLSLEFSLGMLASRMSPLTGTMEGRKGLFGLTV